MSLGQALARHGFSLGRDEWSLLALGFLGWIQMTNFALTDTMTIAGALGYRRDIGQRAASGTWALRLTAGYGVFLMAARHLCAGSIRPTAFPPALPSGGPPRSASHGMFHLVSGSVGCFLFDCDLLRRSPSLRRTG